MKEEDLATPDSTWGDHSCPCCGQVTYGPMERVCVECSGAHPHWHEEEVTKDQFSPVGGDTDLALPLAVSVLKGYLERIAVALEKANEMNVPAHEINKHNYEELKKLTGSGIIGAQIVGFDPNKGRGH